jgi:hypothetical protein
MKDKKEIFIKKALKTQEKHPNRNAFQIYSTVCYLV